ncbi:MAG TPA: formylglycine-generating enzyme family protein [Chloroflexi bacterium]|nr:formylglycine-generating enzyme family protein [Chloroflexota bacterium]
MKARHLTGCCIWLLTLLAASCWGKGEISKMAYIPAGAFIMGDETGRPDERPVHIVYLEGFHIDRYEVTVEEYARFLNAIGSLWGCDGHLCADVKSENPQSHILIKDGLYQPEPGYERHPITWVSWFGADAYCRFYGKRLPTEAEWEKAARGTDGRLYPWGDIFSPDRANADGVLSGTVPVGSYPEGLSPYGLHDMAGNVWEWVADWYEPYPGSGYRSPFFGKYKVVRGGSWNHPAADARCSARDFAHPARRIGVVGFRCAK